MKNQQLEYYKKNVYGNPTIYLADDDLRTMWGQLSGKVTIDKSDMELLTSMFGVTFVQVFEPEKAKVMR